MAKFLMALLFGALMGSAWADASLVGEWRSDGDARSLPGQLKLNRDGSFVMTPRGVAAVTGTYTAQSPRLTLRLNSSPELPAEGVYLISEDGKSLVLQFPTGQQKFVRITTTE